MLASTLFCIESEDGIWAYMKIFFVFTLKIKNSALWLYFEKPFWKVQIWWNIIHLYILRQLQYEYRVDKYDS